MKYRNFFFYVIITMFVIVSGCASTPLIKASADGDSSAVQQLINQGANINEPDSGGYTPLMHAIWSEKTETAKVLINKGADINAKDKNGYTPLLWASSYGNLDIAKLLIDKGADVNAKGNDKSTPYLLAILANNTELAQLLVNKGADLNIINKQGGDALIDAVDKGSYKLTELLLDKGANVNSKDFTNTTPIMHAVLRTTNEKLISLLIERGANLDEKDDEGYTPLEYALYVRKFALAEEIKKGMAYVRKDMPGAKIVFIREAEFLSTAQDVFIYIDDKIVANLYSENSTEYIDINSGKCTLSIKGSNLAGNYVKSFDAVAGQTYYFEVTRRAGNIIAGVVGGAVGVLVDRAIQGDEAGIFKITQLEESVAKEKIKAINEKRKSTAPNRT